MPIRDAMEERFGLRRPTGSGEPRTQAVYYRDRDGREPVDEFIEAVPELAAREAIDEQIDLLNGQAPDAPPLPFPHSSQVQGPLRELRCHHGRILYRILYRRSGNLFVLLHALEKRARSLSARDIAIAEQRFADFSARMNAPRRHVPRAAGHDAPPKRRAPRP